MGQLNLNCSRCFIENLFFNVYWRFQVGRASREPLRPISTLYMAALVAARLNHQLKAFYQWLRAGGKPAKVALTAVMRKLIVLMNHTLKNPNFVLQN